MLSAKWHLIQLKWNCCKKISYYCPLKHHIYALLFCASSRVRDKYRFDQSVPVSFLDTDCNYWRTRCIRFLFIQIKTNGKFQTSDPSHWPLQKYTTVNQFSRTQNLLITDWRNTWVEICNIVAYSAIPRLLHCITRINKSLIIT